MRRAVLVAAVAALLSAPIATAAADSSVTVRGLDFPSSSTYLTYFGCESLFGTSNEAPHVRISKDGRTPASRSFGMLVRGSGTASGPVHLTDSIADTTVAGFSASATGGGAGAAYVWYVTDDLDDGQVWVGHADLSVAGPWQYVDAAAATYTWQLLDAATGDSVIDDAGTGTMTEFTDEHGDGPGYLLSGLGCDGNAFSIDNLQFGGSGAVTTYDLEGMQSSTEMRGKLKGDDVESGIRVAPGTAVTLTGTASDGTPAPIGVPMVLQSSTGGGFKDVGGPISADDDAVVRAVVKPEVTTTYRWYLPDLGYAASDKSNEFTIVILPPAGRGSSGGKSEEPSSAASASSDPSADSGAAEESEADEPEVPPLPSQEPTEEPTQEPSAEPTEDAPTESPSEPAEDPASGESTDATP